MPYSKAKQAVIRANRLHIGKMLDMTSLGAVEKAKMFLARKLCGLLTDGEKDRIESGLPEWVTVDLLRSWLEPNAAFARELVPPATPVAIRVSCPVTPIAAGVSCPATPMAVVSNCTVTPIAAVPSCTDVAIASEPPGLESESEPPGLASCTSSCADPDEMHNKPCAVGVAPVNVKPGALRVKGRDEYARVHRGYFTEKTEELKKIWRMLAKSCH